MNFQYTTTFANLQVKPVVSEEKDKYLSLASIDSLKKAVYDLMANYYLANNDKP